LQQFDADNDGVVTIDEVQAKAKAQEEKGEGLFGLELKQQERRNSDSTNRRNLGISDKLEGRLDPSLTGS